MPGKKYCTQCGALAAPTHAPERTAQSSPTAATAAPEAPQDDDATDRWIDEQLVALGLPSKYGLPPREGHEVSVQYLRSCVALGMLQLQEDTPKEAVLSASQAIDDPALGKMGYEPLMAAAYYVRGLGYEKQGNLVAARDDYRKSLSQFTLPMARAALQRVK